MVGRRSSVGCVSLVVASVLLLVLSSLPLLVLSRVPTLLPHLRSANVRFLGSSSLSAPPLRAQRFLAKALFTTTGSIRSLTIGTVVRLLPRSQPRSIRSRSDREFWLWQRSCGQWEMNKQRSALRKLLRHQSNQIRRADKASQSLECGEKCGCAEDESTRSNG